MGHYFKIKAVCVGGWGDTLGNSSEAVLASHHLPNLKDFLVTISQNGNHDWPQIYTSMLFSWYVF